MIAVDTSALVAILLAEPEAPIFTERLRAVMQPRMSVANLFETFMVLEGRTRHDLRDRIMRVIIGLGVQVEP